MTSSSTKRPRVVCHMAMSLDGRIVVDGWPGDVSSAVRQHYDEIHASYGADGWMCGRVTMEPFAKHIRAEEDVAPGYERADPREDFRVPGHFDSFAFAIDSRGRLAWDSNDIGGDHVVAILTELVSDDYLRFLRQRAVSYVLAGARDVDLGVALEKIGEQFGVRTLMLEGGGRINGGMLRAGLIDEMSVLVVPVGDGRTGFPALLDVDHDSGAPQRLTLEHVERRADDMLWLRYRVDRGALSERR